MGFNKAQIETAHLGMETVDDVLQSIKMKRGEKYYLMLVALHNIQTAVRMSNAIFFTVVTDGDEASRLMDGIQRAQFPLMHNIYMNIIELGGIGAEHAMNCAEQLSKDCIMLLEIVDRVEATMEKQKEKK